MRLEITRKSDLAVRALCSLQDSGRVKGPDLAKRIGTSPAFLAQVMAPLVQAEWVHSDRGPTGGYELMVDLSKLSILELIEEIEGPTDNGRCVLRGGSCPTDQYCALHDAWLPARSALLQTLANTPVAIAAGCVVLGWSPQSG